MTASRLTLLLPVALLACVASMQAQWTTPTAEELAMTSIPEVPGAPAVYLFTEQTADDSLHMKSYYVRLKVLTEGGKERANVELPYSTGLGSAGVTDIAGRTIHPDGTVIPFTGKPYEKLDGKFGDHTRKEKVFTLPDVEVGSIIEYRYKYRLDDNYYSSPDWYIQSSLYTRKAHYMWRPTARLLLSDEGKTISSAVAWTPILPVGAVIKQTPLHIAAIGPANQSYVQLDLEVHDIPPVPHEEYMPATDSLSYRVLFYYTDVASPLEFWKNTGKRWSKAEDKFIGNSPVIQKAVQDSTAAGDTQEQKLRKLYALVMTLENTDYTRERTTSEEKAAGLKEAVSAADVLNRKRGTGDQMAGLFVALARAAGMKAYVMSVANRSERIFLATYLNARQLDDDIAIVNVDGKERFFDPGQRFCAFGQLAWKHNLTHGLRQVDGGTSLAEVNWGSYKDETTKRVADLTLDDSGLATGTVTLTETGNAALGWRQQGLRGDDTALNTDLRSHMEHMLPGGMEVRVTAVEGLTDADKPLVIHYAVKGAIGSSTGKRLLIPADLFEGNTRPRFLAAKRDLPVDLHYAAMRQDAIRVKLPSSMVIESTPQNAKQTLNTEAMFELFSRSTPNSITFFRNLSSGRAMYLASEYSDLRSFFTKLEANDQEALVLTRANPTTAKATP